MQGAEVSLGVSFMMPAERECVTCCGALLFCSTTLPKPETVQAQGQHVPNLISPLSH